VTDPGPRPTREEQRRRTEARILAAARQLFAEAGYDRTTIRAVAAAAGVDGGLVMHYFGSKGELFARASELPAGSRLPAAADEMAEALLASLAERLVGEPAASLAVLRSMLTHADAADRYRAAAGPELAQISAAIPAADADVRAGLLSAIVHGVIIERYLLRTSRLVEASPEQVVDLLRPCLHALAAAPPPRPRGA
jgi:AcrR family transcriptional regulator